MPARHAATVKAARELGLNRIIPASNPTADVAPLGFIVTGGFAEGGLGLTVASRRGASAKPALRA